MSQVAARELMLLPSDQDYTGRTLGEEEIASVSEAIKTGTLTSTKGSFVKTLENTFAEKLGAKHAHACASGTAAIHTALAAINPNPGDEIITSSITDMGALTPILYQGAVPVFAEVDPATCNVTAESIAACISERTKAIIVTHLFGNPCDMTPIMEVANAGGIPVIEDCAQAFMASDRDRYVGTIGAIGCFSLQQGKHITTGEGGLVVCNDDALARRMFLFINKAWGYGDTNPDHYFIALNYRMSELQGAVAVAQMHKLDMSVRNRIDAAEILTSKLRDVEGIHTPHVNRNAVHTYWKYCLRVNKEQIEGGAIALANLLKQRGISSAPRYIQKPAFMCEVFQKQRTFGDSRWPFTLARPEAIAYEPERFPQTFAALDQVLVLPWNENYTQAHIEYIASSIIETANELRRA